MNPGISPQEFDALLRLNESDPKEAVRRFLAGISVPIQKRKSVYPMIQIDRKEYNFAVSLWESGERYLAIDLLESLAVRPGFEAASQIAKPAFLSVGRKRRGRNRAKVNIYVKLFHSGIDPYHPVCMNDRSAGQKDIKIEPGDTFEGFVYFPHLVSWIRSGRKARLLGL